MTVVQYRGASTAYQRLPFAWQLCVLALLRLFSQRSRYMPQVQRMPKRLFCRSVEDVLLGRREVELTDQPTGQAIIFVLFENIG